VRGRGSCNTLIARGKPPGLDLSCRLRFPNAMGEHFAAVIPTVAVSPSVLDRLLSLFPSYGVRSSGASNGLLPSQRVGITLIFISREFPVTNRSVNSGTQQGHPALFGRWWALSEALGCFGWAAALGGSVGRCPCIQSLSLQSRCRLRSRGMHVPGPDGQRQKALTGAPSRDIPSEPPRKIIRSSM